MKKRRFEIEIDLEKIIDDAIETTISEGLSADKVELLSTYGRETFTEMQTNYRYYGTLFSMNLKSNLEKEIENILKEKEN